MSARDVLVVGNLRGASRSALTTAANSLKLNITEIASVEEATAALEKHPWCAVLIDTTLSGASRFCAEARAHRTLLGIPFIALSPRLTDLAFLNALRWGADDVVALGATEALSVRLGALIGPAAVPEAAPTRGEAVVADPDRRRGNGLGRAIHTAGYSVRYATDTTSARFYATKPDVELFILNAELCDPKAFITETQQGGSKARWVVLAKAARTEELQEELSALKGVVVMSSGGPPENVLFAVNLLYPSEASRRGEIRALFGTVVFFRAVGDYRDECGFSYTASPQGLYVRTLAPPPSAKVWVELIPPDGERRVRLVGKVAWSRGYGRQAGEAAPPGFGVRIVDGLGEDLALWSECLKGLEFKAPATLVPEARFSVPAPARPLAEAAPLPSLASTSLRAAVRPGMPVLPSSSPTINQPPAQAAAIPSGTSGDETASPRPSVAPSVPQPPPSTSMDRLSAAAKARISTRPSLRLSLPSPVSIRRDPLAKPARLSRPPVEEKPQVSLPDPAPTPKRVGQGRTVMGLGILQRDGSLTLGTQSSDSDPTALGAHRASVLPTPPASPAVPAPHSLGDVERSPDNSNGDEQAVARSEAIRIPPVTGRTLSYGSDRPLAFDSKFQAAADALPFPPEDISERPTLSDRFSLEQAERIASESLTPAAPEMFDSLPPDALESEAPSPLPKQGLALARRPLAPRPLSDEPPALSAEAETDRNWVSLESIPAEHRLSDLPPAPVNDGSFASNFGDLGATLPGVVVDTVVSPSPPATEDVSPSAEVEPRLAATRTDPHVPDALPYELGEYRGPRAQVAEDSLEVNGLPPKRRGVAPVLFAVAVAAAVVALMVRTKEPAGRSPDSTPAAQVPAPVPEEPRRLDTPAVEGAATQRPIAEVPQVSAANGAAADATAAPPKPTAAPAAEAPSAAPPHAAVSATASAVSGVENPTVVPQPAAHGPNPTPGGPVADTEPPRDPSTLTSKNAWLFVHSSVSAHVFVHGVDAGLTNTWLETACGTRFVRLGRTAGDWLSPGVPTIIRCRSANTIEVAVP